MRRITAFGQLAVLTVLLSVVQIAYVVAHTTPSAIAELLFGYTFSLYVVFWVVADAEQRRRVPCYDFGLLIGAFYPASLLWYLLWSRGGRGLWLVAAILALACVPRLCAAVAWLIVNRAA